MSQFKSIRHNIEVGKAKTYIKKGITVKDVDLTMDWFRDVARPKLNEKAQELKQKGK
jgi:hypothetical protein